MITKPTVLVLGAGASHPYGFPVGESLTLDIVEGLSSVTEMFNVISHFIPEEQYIKTFAKRLRDSQQASIDAFLTDESNHQFHEIGKLAIAYQILMKEDPGKITRTGSEEKDLKWYTLFYRSLGTTLRDFYRSRENLSILTFNYDRSLECFFHQALKNNFLINDEEIEQFLEEMPIIHLYGSVGKYPYQNNQDGIRYGVYLEQKPHKTIPVDMLAEAAQNIQILPDRNQEFSSFQEALPLLLSAEKICFLGFGFHPINLERLLKDVHTMPKRIWATTFRTGNSERARIESYFIGSKRMMNSRLILGKEREDSYKFLKENYIFN